VAVELEQVAGCRDQAPFGPDGGSASSVEPVQAAVDNRERRHSTLGQLSQVDYENSTLRGDGANLAASRLASLNNKIKPTTTAAKAA
jgi:hypothetical protein